MVIRKNPHIIWSTVKMSWVRRCSPNVDIEPRYEKTGFRGFRPGPTQTGLYSHRRWLEA